MDDFLVKLGVDPALNGFRYLATMIALYGLDNSAPMGNLYIDTAKRHNTTPSRVERCCRNALEKLVNDNPIDKYYPVLLRLPDFDSQTGTYTVSQFIALSWLALLREQSPV